jgi:hypothetical protein
MQLETKRGEHQDENDRFQKVQDDLQMQLKGNARCRNQLETVHIRNGHGRDKLAHEDQVYQQICGHLWVRFNTLLVEADVKKPSVVAVAAATAATAAVTVNDSEHLAQSGPGSGVTCESVVTVASTTSTAETQKVRSGSDRDGNTLSTVAQCHSFDIELAQKHVREAVHGIGCTSKLTKNQLECLDQT